MESYQRHGAAYRQPLIPLLHKSNSHSHSHSHDHGSSSGVVFIDVDELVHAGNVLAKQAIAAVQQDIEHPGEALVQEARELIDSPHSWFQLQSVPSSRADIAMALPVSVVMLPLALLAMKAGVEEICDAQEKHTHLTQKAQALAQQSMALAFLHTTVPCVKAHDAALQQQRVDVDYELETTHTDLGIGVSSLLSGSAILLKALQEVALQTSVLVLAKGSSVSSVLTSNAALATASTVGGLLSVWLLGPLAGVFAVGLGGFFWHNARRETQRVRVDRREIEVRLAQQQVTCDTPKSKAVLAPYRAFLQHKLDSRERFITQFRNWNGGFLVGSTLYTVSVLAKVALSASALVFGVALFTSMPPVLGVLLVLGIVGAVIMGVCSHQFLFSHGKSKRHQDDAQRDHPLLTARKPRPMDVVIA